MAQKTPKRRHSTYLDVEILEWLKERGQRLDRTVDYQIREILRDTMERFQPSERKAS